MEQFLVVTDISLYHERETNRFPISIKIGILQILRSQETGHRHDPFGKTSPWSWVMLRYMSQTLSNLGLIFHPPSLSLSSLEVGQTVSMTNSNQSKTWSGASFHSFIKVVAGMNSGHPFPFFPADPTSGDIRVILAAWNFEGENGGEKRYRCTQAPKDTMATVVSKP